MHAEALEWCRLWASPQVGQALDVGGRYVNGTARDCWPNMQWTVLDIAGDPDNHLDRVIEADARTWLPDQPYNLVLSTELLEHVHDWRLCLNTMVNAMARNGFLVLTCAGLGRRPHGMHGAEDLASGEHYRNINPVYLHAHLTFLNLKAIEIDVKGTDVRAVAWKNVI